MFMITVLRSILIYRFNVPELGCPDLSPPKHAWYKRDGDQAVIGCEWSQKTWHLSCDGRSWSGVVGNCSGPGNESYPFLRVIDRFMHKLFRVKRG